MDIEIARYACLIGLFAVICGFAGLGLSLFNARMESDGHAADYPRQADRQAE